MLAGVLLSGLRRKVISFVEQSRIDYLGPIEAIQMAATSQAGVLCILKWGYV